MNNDAPETLWLEMPVGLRDGGSADARMGVTVWSGAPSPTPGENAVPADGCAIIYFHGGGFLYGERDDLPALYRELIADAGHALFCVDYPLAPESSLEQIVNASLFALKQLVAHELPARGYTRYVLFGRSAGAALALLLAKRLRLDAPELPQPAAIWDFYGYHDLAAPFVSEPSRYYAAMPAVDEATVQGLLAPAGTALTSGPKPRRFALYIHARQTGRWKELLGVMDGDEATFLLSPNDIAALPPVFIAASTGDNDVPFRQSKQLSRMAPRARMHQVYDLEHDFDRDVRNPAGMQAYTEALSFLSAICAETDRPSATV